ncbi:Protein-tyrosine-phosphatase protein [Dioscorea alata]|uniref:Protein-tyrosine-phosphatase protein n=4 Tax=Dioscorea alata TaxID=55571 RepID=A0ACB7WHY1_DIOAL|nr:Protein-tyrosine-phosphatase protein [Dioscorea alata]KAH7687343.1 Protein-tyrosine-phosphatase protein [Dioscorea alata]KAH7687344.1 Protein-tyrosine-phosphatase protein [Dioscorea alata]
MDDLVNASTIPCENMIVYIWDMDETLILLKSLLDGSYAESFNGVKESRKGTDIGKRWENHILQVCDDYFFYEQMENYNQPCLDALSLYDDGQDLSDYNFNSDGFKHMHDDADRRKLAYRQRVIAQKYAQGLHHVLDQQLIQLWDDLYQMTDNYTDGWFSSGHAFLQQILGRNTLSTSNHARCQHINVLVTSGSLIPSLVKCLLFKLDDVFSYDNVYSSWDVGKLQCFSWIKERFSGQAVRFCVIGDGMEECMAAQRMSWPFIQIDFRPGGVHRFPGLTLRMVEHYIDVIYGPSNSDNCDE